MEIRVPLKRRRKLIESRVQGGKESRFAEVDHGGVEDEYTSTIVSKS